MLKLDSAPQVCFVAWLLLGLFPFSASAASKLSKADLDHPTPPTSHLTQPAQERKGKKAALPAKRTPSKPTKTVARQSQGNAQSAKTPTNKTGKRKNVAATRSLNQQPITKGKAKSVPAKSRAPRQTAPPNLATASGKQGVTPRQRPPVPADYQQAEEPPIPRLVSASYLPAVADESTRQGKFGKNSERAPREEETARQPTRPRENQTARSREAERSTDWSDNAPIRTQEATDNSEVPTYEMASPDKVEVIEYGSTAASIATLLALPNTRPLTPFGAVVTRNNAVPGKRKDLVIPEQRVLEIQYELAKRGFYNTEPSGVYDEMTIQAMWEFQKNYGLPATGYPTAHSLKRLGLTSF